MNGKSGAFQWTSCAGQPSPNINGIQSVKVRFSEENRIVQYASWRRFFFESQSKKMRADLENTRKQEDEPAGGAFSLANVKMSMGRLKIVLISV